MGTSCNGQLPVTNDLAVRKDCKIRYGNAWVFGFVFFNDSDGVSPYDVSDISFRLVVNTAGPNPLQKMEIINAQWDRPETNHIQKVYNSFTELLKTKHVYELVATYLDGRVQTLIYGEINFV